MKLTSDCAVHMHIKTLTKQNLTFFGVWGGLFENRGDDVDIQALTKELLVKIFFCPYACTQANESLFLR
jgi:hypothetical protein